MKRFNWFDFGLIMSFVAVMAVAGALYVTNRENAGKKQADTIVTAP